MFFKISKNVEKKTVLALLKTSEKTKKNSRFHLKFCSNSPKKRKKRRFHGFEIISKHLKTRKKR